MSSYFPPTENTPIFNNAYFTNSTGSGGISLNQADSLYVSLSKSQEVEGLKDFVDGLQTDTILPSSPSTALNFTTTSRTNFQGDVNVASGKRFLVNGTPLVAPQTGNSGKYLTTNGTSTSWGNPPSLAGGSNTQIQFNDNGALNGSTGMTYNKTTNSLTVSAGTTVSGSLSSSGISNSGLITTDNIVNNQKITVGSQQTPYQPYYYRGGTITCLRGVVNSGSNVVPLPVANGAGFVCGTAYNSAGNWMSFQGVSSGNTMRQLNIQMNGANPSVSGINYTLNGQNQIGLQFSGTALSTSCNYVIYLFSDGFWG